MKSLSFDDLRKLAENSPKARATLIKMASKDNTEFNESVPSMNQDEAAYQDQGNQSAAPPPEQVAAEPAATPIEQPAPAPEGPEAAGARAAQAFLGPEVMQAAMSGDPGAADLVARTAGQIAGAVSEATLKAVPDAAGMGTAGVPAEGGIPGEGAVGPGAQAVPAAPATPEQDLANEIVPPPQAPAPTPAPAVQAPTPAEQAPVEPGQEQGNMDQGKSEKTQVTPNAPVGPSPAGGPGQSPATQGGEQVSMNDVKKLLELAKAGKI